METAQGSSVSVIGDYQRLAMRLGRGGVAHAIVRLAAGICEAFQSSTREDVHGATAVIWMEVDPLGPHHWMYHVESSIEERLLREMITLLAPALDGWAVVSGVQRSGSSLPAFGYRHGEWILYLVEAERNDGSRVRSALTVDWENTGMVPGVQTFPEFRVEGRRFVFRDAERAVFNVRWAESVRPGAGYLLDEYEPPPTEGEGRLEIQRDWEMLTYADIDILRKYGSPRERATVTAMFQWEERNRQGPYSVVIFQRGGNPETPLPEIVRGFRTLDAASEYCRRFVRAQLEKARFRQATPEEVVGHWEEGGLDAHVECGLFFGCDGVKEWAATTASPGETDYDAVPRGAGLILPLADAHSLRRR